MANKTSNNDIKKYYQKIGIVPTSIDNIKKIIKENIKNTIECWKHGRNIERQTFKIIGNAGIGKTQISIQLAEELTSELGVKFNCIVIKAPVLSRDDLLCPFPIIDNGHSRFKMLYSDFVPMDEDSYGLFIIDELSRGDSNFQQLCWQIQNELKVHTHPLPKHWFVICIDNPDDEEYSLNMVEDAAGLRRVLHLYSEVNVEAFLKYAETANFHPAVIEFIQIHPEYLYDFDHQKIGMIYANPASWERVSNILWGYENRIEEKIDILTTLFGGLLNSNMTRLFISYLIDKKDISPKDIFFEYDKVRKNIIGYTNDQNNAKLSQILESFVTFLLTSKPTHTIKELKNVSLFLTDIPKDISVMFLTKLANIDPKSSDFMYFAIMHRELDKNFPDYKINFYEEMVKVNTRISK